MSITSLTKYTLLVSLIIWCSSANAQNYLAITKYRNAKNILIQIGEHLKVKKSDMSKPIEGMLYSIDSGQFIIQIDTLFDTCFVSNVDWIKYRIDNGGTSFLRGSGLNIIAGGPAYLVLGATNNFIKDMPPAFREHNMITAGIISVVGLIVYGTYELVSNRKFRKRRWKFRPTNFNELI